MKISKLKNGRNLSNKNEFSPPCSIKSHFVKILMIDEVWNGNVDDKLYKNSSMKKERDRKGDEKERCGLIETDFFICFYSWNGLVG